MRRFWWLTVAITALALVSEGRTPTRLTPEQSIPAVPKVAIHSWTLPNGLIVIFAPHRQVPSVTVQVWYHVGSKDEEPGIRGVAHMFEHMMFKGSEHVPPEAHAQLLSAVGGSINAFTSQDVTAYHNTVPAQYLDYAMRLEAERMRNLLLTQKTIDSEREVVKEEKRLRLENDPIGRAFEAIHALAYRVHPYSWTPAGDIPDLNRVTKSDCQHFYNTYYVPNNAALVVVGDVSKAEVHAAAERHFGSMKEAADPPRVTAEEPPQERKRTKRGEWSSQRAVVLGAYHIPAAKHPDQPALEVLQAILSEGDSSRLNQRLVRKERVAVEAGAFVWAHEHPGLFFIYALGGEPAQTVDGMERALLEEIAGLAKAGIRSSELEKARNQLSTGHLRKLRTAWGLAYQIGQSTYLRGDPRAFLGDAVALDRVTAQDVRRVATTYLRPSNLSLVMVPASISPQPAPPPAQKGGPTQ